MCRAVFPSSRCLFLYRDVVAVAKSVYRFTAVTPWRHVLSLLGRLSDRMIKTSWVGMDGIIVCVRLDNDLSFGVLVYAKATSTYLDMRRRGFNVTGLRYEDLVARPLDMCCVVMEFCGLPVSLAELGVKAFEVDSQRNSMFAKSRLGHIKDPQLTPQTKAQLNELLNKYGVPLIGEPNVLEGTLSYSE